MKLALGTAQFGLDYGINNKKGKIPKKEVFGILDYAIKNGIDTLHTSYAYGNSENIIGEFVQKNKSYFKIISKFPTENLKNAEHLFYNSLKNLHSEKVYGCLLHDFKLFLQKPDIWSTLEKLKNQDIVEKIGFSVYYPQEIEHILNKEIQFDIVQLPFSILDQRFTYLLNMLKKKNVDINVRSVFLQGLLFKNVDKLKDNFTKIKNKLLCLQSISKKTDIPISALCINFVVLNEQIDKVIVGVDSLQNLQDNIKSLKYKNNVKIIYEELLGLKENDEKITLPINWNYGEGGYSKMKKNIEFKGSKLYFRKLDERDATTEYSNWLNDPDVNIHLHPSHREKKTTIEDLKKYIHDKNNKGGCCFFGIFMNENDKHIGNIKLEPIDFNNRKATFSMMIGDKDYWGKGIGTVATKMMLEYGLKKLNLKTVDLRVSSLNKGAIRAYEKAGFDIKYLVKIENEHDRYIMEISKE